jgi:hypothetical protein
VLQFPDLCTGQANTNGDQGLTLYELILKADSILPDAFLNSGIITRYNPDLTTTAVSFNLQEDSSYGQIEY